MNKKTLIILFGIFIILVIAATYSWWGQYLNIGNTSSQNTELNFSAFSESTTDKISIAKNGEEEKNISKEGGKWMINGFDADQKEIDDFFEKLSSLKVQSLVSKNPENHSNFDVTEQNGFTLTITSGNTDFSFVIGKRGTTFNSFYVKAKDSDNVYKVSGSLREKLSQSVTAWRDKIVVNIPRDKIQKIEIASQEDILTVAKDENGWKAEKSGKTATLDETTANRLLAAFNPMEASGFLNEDGKKEFQDAKDKTIIRVFGDNGETMAEINLLEKESEWWLQAKGKEIFYKIPTYKLSDIFLKDDEIFGAEEED